MPIAPALLGLLFALGLPLQARRIYWGPLPGTEDSYYSGICWDSRHGRVVTTGSHQVGSVDPLTGRMKILAQVPWTPGTLPEGGTDQEGPSLGWPVVDAGGFIYLGVDGDAGDDHDGRIRRIGPDGRVEVIAGGGAGKPWSGEAVADARTIGLDGPSGLALAADGRIFFRNWIPGLEGKGGTTDLCELTPHYGPPGAAASRYSLRRIPMPRLEEGRDGTGGAEPLDHCRGVAAGPEGEVVVVDSAHRVWRAVPRFQEGMEVWPWEHIAGEGWRIRTYDYRYELACSAVGHADARETPLCQYDSVAVGPGGRIYVAGGCHLWELTPQAVADGPARWRSRAIMGGPGTAGVGGPAAEVHLESRSIRCLAPLPRGGLLVASTYIFGEGIRLIGPEGADAALAKRVAEHGEALRKGRFWEAVGVLTDLGRKRDQAARKDGEILDLPFRTLNKTLSRKPDLALGGRSLPAVLRRMVGAFLIDPAELAMRADRAMAAMDGGGELLGRLFAEEPLKQLMPPFYMDTDAEDKDAEEEGGDGQAQPGPKRQRINPGS